MPRLLKSLPTTRAAKVTTHRLVVPVPGVRKAANTTNNNNNKCITTTPETRNTTTKRSRLATIRYRLWTVLLGQLADRNPPRNTRRRVLQLLRRLLRCPCIRRRVLLVGRESWNEANAFRIALPNQTPVKRVRRD